MGIGNDLEEIARNAEAYDYEDGDISALIQVESHNVDVNVAREYELVLLVEDSDHNQDRFTVQVLIVDYSYPSLDANGGVLFLGQEFDPLNYAYAWDMDDGDITDRIEVLQNDVNTQVEGSYTVTYSVTNSSGKTTTKTATFEVVKLPEIKIFIIFNNNSYEVETNLFEGIMRFNSPVLIPAGSLVGLEIYMDGELMGSVENVILMDEILPNITYLLTSENENELRAIALDEDEEKGGNEVLPDTPADYEELPKTGLPE